ncbi:MAG TPA: hypothetical protein VN648_11055, partial [Candidatus Methylomirabilis sp.]|nr:hypothetical protein [Candidatus Methylomirabilis sp.]
MGSLQTQLNTLTTTNTQLQGQVTSLGQQIQAVSSNLAAVQRSLAQSFNNAQFAIQGDSPTQQMQNLVNAILGLNRGRLQGIYQNLGGK